MMVEGREKRREVKSAELTTERTKSLIRPIIAIKTETSEISI